VLPASFIKRRGGGEVVVSDPPIGGLGPQGFGPADLGEVPASSSELGNSPKLSLGSSVTQVLPTAAPAVVLVTNPPLCSAPAGPLGGGGSISVSAHAGPGVGYPASAPVHPGSGTGVPGFGPGHGDFRSPAGVPLDTRQVSPWVSIPETITREPPPGIPGLTQSGVHRPIGDFLNPNPGFQPGSPGQFTASATPFPVGSNTGWGTQFPYPGLSGIAGGVLPGQAFTGLSSATHTSVPTPWAYGSPPGPQQPAYPLGVGNAGAYRAPCPNFPRPLGPGRGHRLTRFQRWPLRTRR